MKPSLTLFVTWLALSVASTGCFMFDELDKANALLDAHAPKAAPDAKKQIVAGAKQARTADELGIGEWWTERRKDVSEWWRLALEEDPVPPDPNDGIVHCEIDGTTSFKRKSDCQLRGGQYSRMKPKLNSDT